MAHYWRYVLLLLGIAIHAVSAKPIVDRAPTPFQIDGFAASGYPYKTQSGYLFWYVSSIFPHQTV
jgi:hypothetical protein